MAAGNSKVYYIIQQGSGRGDTIARVPKNDKETIQNAIEHIGGASRVAGSKIWVSRPAPSGMGSEQILPVDWQAITDGADMATNYQLLPGDRVFVANESSRGKETVKEGRPRSADGTIRGEPTAAPSAKLAAKDEAQFAELIMANMVHSLKQTIQLVESNLARSVAARREVETAREAYEQGSVTLDLLLDAQRRATDAETTYVKSLVWFRNSENALARAENERILAMFELEQAKKARDDSRELWEMVRNKNGDAAHESQARAQYDYYRTRAVVALTELQKAAARVQSLRASAR